MLNRLAVLALALLPLACGPVGSPGPGPDDMAGDGDGDLDLEDGDGDGDEMLADLPDDMMPIPDLGGMEGDGDGDATGDGDGDPAPLHCCVCDGVWCPCAVPQDQWCQDVGLDYPEQCLDACGL